MNRFILVAAKLVLAVIIAWYSLSLFSSKRGIVEYINAHEDRVKVTKQLAVLSEKNRMLTAEVEAVKQPGYEEEEIKIRLQKGKKGEIFYHFEN